MTLSANIYEQAEGGRERFTPAVGIVYAVMQLAAIAYALVAVFPEKPAVGAPIREQAAWYAQHGDVLRVGNYLLALPVLFLLPFLAGLFTVSRRLEGGSGVLSLTALIGGIAFSMLWPFGCMITNLGATVAQNGGDAATIWAIDGLAPLSLALSAVPRAVLLVAASIILLRFPGALYAIGWCSIVLGFLTIAGSATLVTGALFPLLSLSDLLFSLWVLSICTVLFGFARGAPRVTTSHHAARSQ